MANPNVLFKRGLQQNLPASAIDGVFYLTTDTHRLYVGQGTTPVLLNQTVQFVSNIAELTAKSASWTEAEKQAHLHDLYYVLPGADDATHGGNILAVWCYDTTQNAYAWVQINPDHNTYVNRFALETLAGSANDANVNITMERNDGESETIVLNVKGDGKTVKIQAASNKTGFIIKGDTYSLSRPAVGEIKLTSALGQNPSSVKLVSGDNVTIADGTANNEIKISSHDTKNSNVTLGLNTSTGALTATILDTNGDEKSGTTGAISMKYGASGNLSTPLGGTMNVYSISEIDNKLKDLNGLTFIGSVGENGTYKMGADYKIYQGTTALTLHNGDMFLVAGEVTYGKDAKAQTGDLLIATGTENANGALTSVAWTYVPSGDDMQLDTTYRFDGTTDNNTMTISSKTTTGEEGVAGKLTFKAGTATTVTSTIDGNTAEKNEFLTVTVGHADVSCVRTEATDDHPVDLSNVSSVDVITGVTVNPQGHVTGVTATRVLPPKYKLSPTPKLTANTSGVETSVQIQHGLILGGDAPVYETVGYKLQSNSLTIKANAGNVQIDCVWGEF